MTKCFLEKDLPWSTRCTGHPCLRGPPCRHLAAAQCRLQSQARERTIGLLASTQMQGKVHQFRLTQVMSGHTCLKGHPCQHLEAAQSRPQSLARGRTIGLLASTLMQGIVYQVRLVQVRSGHPCLRGHPCQHLAVAQCHPQSLARERTIGLQASTLMQGIVHQFRLTQVMSGHTCLRGHPCHHLEAAQCCPQSLARESTIVVLVTTLIYNSYCTAIISFFTSYFSLRDYLISPHLTSPHLTSPHLT